MNGKSRRALFITLSNIGDAVMTTPVLRMLEAKYPGITIDISARSRTAALFQNFDRLGIIVPQPEQRTLAERLTYLRRIRHRQYDVCVDLKSPVLSLFMNAKETYRRQGRPRRDEPAVLSHARVLSPTVHASMVPTPTLWPHVNDHRCAQKIICAAKGQRAGPLIAVGPGANWEPKCWPRERFVTFIHALTNQLPNTTFLILGDAADADKCGFVAAQCPATHWAKNTSLNEVAALLAYCDLFVGNDSGLGHIASAVGTPTITIFGPGEPIRYRPWGPRALIITADDRQIDSVLPEQVVSLSNRLLQGALD